MNGRCPLKMTIENIPEFSQIKSLEYELIINRKLFALKVITEKQYNEVAKIIMEKIRYYKTNN